MNRDTPQSKRRIGSRGQILKTEEELRRSRSVGTKKRAVLRYVNQGASVPPSLALYAPPGYTGSFSSGAGSSRPRPPSPPAANSSSSGYVDYATTDSSLSSDESDGDKVVECDFVASDEAKQRAMRRMIRRSEHAHFDYVAKEDKELEDALRLFERQEEEKRKLEQLRRQEEEKRKQEQLRRQQAGVIDLDSD